MKTQQVPRWMRNLMMGIIALIWITPSQANAENMSGVSFQVFYDELMPYGDWVKDGRYGYVWLPAVQNDFHPYGSDGHWVMTEYGNTWVSDYDWGWAPFHYGRWYFDNNYQSWAWIPDYNWGPAWVDWRTGGGYYGWAPMGPGFSVNLRINIPTAYWLFVPQHRFAYHNVYNYYVPRANRIKIYNQTTIINNTVVYNNNTYYGGPTRREVQRVTRNSYPVHRVQSTNSAGRASVSRNTVSTYRPDLQSARGRTASAERPSRVISSGDRRTQPASAPSRNSSRTEAVSGRSAGTSAGPSRSSTRTTAPNRSENSTLRSGSSSTRSTRNEEFETSPYSGPQTRTTTPSNSRRSETRPAAPATRQERVRQSETRSTPPSRTQSPTSTQRSTQPRTQSAPAQRSTQSRTQSAPTQRATQTRTQSSSTSRTQPEASRPTVKSAPSRATQSRQSQSAPTRSTPQVKSSSGSRTSPASTSRSTSGSTSSRSSSRTRGNN